MFYNCKSLNVINLANLNVSNVTSVNSLFYNCHELSRVILSGWSLDSIELTENMFCNCSDLFTIIIDDTNSTTVNYIISELPDGNINTSDPIKVVVPTVPLEEVNETTKNVIITNTFVLAEYKFTSGVDTVPNFDGYDFYYMTNDTDNGDGTITRSIESYELPPHIDFIGCEGLLEVLQIELSGTTSLFNLFYNCPNLVSITIPEGVEKISPFAFYYLFSEFLLL